MRGEVPTAELPAFFGRAFHEAAAAAAAAGVSIVGPPFGLYPQMPGATMVVEAGFPVSAAIDEHDEHGAAHRLVLPGGLALRVVHVGPYDTLAHTYAELETWMATHGLHPGSGVWESYLSDPEVEPDPATWRTLIVWPVVGDVAAHPTH